MGLAALNLPDFPEKMEFRAMAHNALDEWLDTFMPFFESKAPPDLKGLSDHFQNTRLMFLGACLQAAVERLHGPLFRQRRADCPRCGQVVLRHTMRDETGESIGEKNQPQGSNCGRVQEGPRQAGPERAIERADLGADLQQGQHPHAGQFRSGNRRTGRYVAVSFDE